MHQLNAAERGDRISDAQLHAIRTWLESGYVGVISEYYHVDTPRGIKRKRHERSAKEDGRIVKNKREKPLEQEQSPVQENSKSVKSESEDPLEQDIGIQECLICAEELTTASFPHQISADCVHRPTCCSACLSLYLEEQINDKPTGQIACPECPIILSYDNVKSLAREDHFITYVDISSIAQTSQLKLTPRIDTRKTPFCPPFANIQNLLTVLVPTAKTVRFMRGAMTSL